MYMFRKLNFWPLPKAPGGRDPKNCAGACAIHVSNSNTKSGWIAEKNFFWPPSPPRYAQVPPLGMTQAAKWKSRLICFISFICEKIYKVWFKNLWNWLCNSDLMIFDLLAPPQGPRARGPKKWRRCVCHLCKKLTHQIWLNFGKNFFWPPQPPTVPPSPTARAWPRLPNENPVWYVLYLSCGRRHTKFGQKIFQIDFVIEI